jgi:DNA-binding NtrC family response regulator
MANRALLVESDVHLAEFWEKVLTGSIPKLSEMERYLIEESLALAEGNQTRAARRLGISRFALRNRMRRDSYITTLPH